MELQGTLSGDVDNVFAWRNGLVAAAYAAQYGYMVEGLQLTSDASSLTIPLPEWAKSKTTSEVTSNG